MKRIILSLALLTACTFTYAQSLVAHWDFSGGAANDVSGNGLNGTPFNTVAAAGKAGAPNTALQFNGVNSGVDVPYDPSMNLQEFSIVAVVKIKNFNANTCQGNTILSRSGGAATNDHYDLLLSDNMNDGSCAVYTPGQTLFSGSAPGTNPNPASASVYSPFTNVGQWYCVAMTYDRTTLRIYVDGVLEVALPWNHAFTSSNAPISIGYFVTGLPLYPYYFDGIIDDLQLWDGPLSAAAVAQRCSACTVEDVQYCSSTSAPGTFSFTPTITPAASNVMWDYGDGTTEYSTASTTVSHSFAPGSYTVCVTVLQENSEEECTRYCFNICVADYEQGRAAKKSATSIQAVPAKMMGDIYPNPTHSELNIPVLQNGKIQISITGIDGKALRTQSFDLKEGSKTATMPTGDLMPGTYFVEINDGKTHEVKPFVKH